MRTLTRLIQVAQQGEAGAADAVYEAAYPDLRRLDREWAAFSRLLDDGLDLPEVVRSRWVHDLPAEHDALRPRLRRLLCGSGAAVAGTFLGTIPKLDDDAPGDKGRVS